MVLQFNMHGIGEPSKIPRMPKAMAFAIGYNPARPVHFSEIFAEHSASPSRPNAPQAPEMTEENCGYPRSAKSSIFFKPD